MQDRIRGHPPLCASILPVGKPVKDPIMSSPLRCEAAGIWLMSALSKAGPVGVDAIGSQIQRTLSYYASVAMRNS